MEEVSGFYTRKSDGAQFTFNATYTSTSWDAAVRKVDGSYHAFIRNSVSDGLKGEALKDAVRDWVHGCIEDRVGVD
jgi:hypothetical protein